jgi:hypothetical protein
MDVVNVSSKIGACADPRLTRWLKEITGCIADGWLLLTLDRSHRRPDRRQALRLRALGVFRNCVTCGRDRESRSRASPRQRTNVMVRHVLFHVTRRSI